MDAWQNSTESEYPWVTYAQANNSGTGSPTVMNLSMGIYNERCEDWKDAQHTLFQLANLCLVVSFLTPTNFHHHALAVRCILGFGYLFFTLWAGLIVCMPDVLIWNIGFFIVNFIFTCYLAYGLLPTRFDSNVDEMYQRLFKPLRLDKRLFKELFAVGSVQVLTKDEFYAREGITTLGTKTSILLKGRCDKHM